ncbi:putative katanin [Leptomonas pyrrhocoris]|uniref:Putative katanin n=1 Tax=Leptomonas pyrrhocoris TaxID=157538 RepID=A0A0M9GAZ8_LEPPY|nr:putative katanin [Leptomonas pyrrhocoris]KPA86577.1 putative katanin [Leptomonas pyrrhocoris]|eukprot:XP_015665016.1 putative katanin [Leptomonas pyrrhocoris]
MFVTSEHLLPCDAYCCRISDNRAKPLVGFGGRDASIHVYPFSGYTRSAWLQGLTEPVTALAFDPDQTFVVGGSDGGKLQMWDLNSEEVARSFTRGHDSTVTDIDVFRSGQFFATVSTNKVLRVWDVRKSSGRQSYKDATAPLCAVQFSPNGKWIATGCARGVVRLYDLAAGRLLHKLELHTGAITSLHFHPDLYYLTVASGDGTVSMWDLDSFEPKFRSDSQHTPVDAVRFCGVHLLATSDHNVRIFDMRNLSDRTAVSLDAPWMMIGDVAYAAAADEAWFVETAGSTATKCKLSLRELQRTADAPATKETAPAPTSLKPLQRVPVATLNNNNNPLFGEVKRKTPYAIRLPPTTPTKGAVENTHNTPGKTSRQPTPPPTPSPPRPQWSTSGPSFPDAAPSSFGHHASELQLVDQLSRESGTTSLTLQQRLTVMHDIRTLWADNQPAAIAQLTRLYDDGQEFGPLFDFLTVMQQQRMKEKLSTDALAGIVELVQIALSTDYEPLVLLGLRTLRSTVTRFRVRVEEARRRARSSQSTGHNDPLGMAQHQRIMEKLAACTEGVLSLSQRRDAVGEEARSVVADLPSQPSSAAA